MVVRDFLKSDELALFEDRVAVAAINVGKLQLFGGIERQIARINPEAKHGPEYVANVLDRLRPQWPAAFVDEILKQRTRPFAGVQALQGERPELRYDPVPRPVPVVELGCFGLVVFRLLEFSHEPLQRSPLTSGKFLAMF